MVLQLHIMMLVTSCYVPLWTVTKGILHKICSHYQELLTTITLYFPRIDCRCPEAIMSSSLSSISLTGLQSLQNVISIHGYSIHNSPCTIFFNTHISPLEGAKKQTEIKFIHGQKSWTIIHGFETLLSTLITLTEMMSSIRRQICAILLLLRCPF